MAEEFARLIHDDPGSAIISAYGDSNLNVKFVHVRNGSLRYRSRVELSKTPRFDASRETKGSKKSTV